MAMEVCCGKIIPKQMTHQFKYCPNCTSKKIEFPHHHRFYCHDCKMVFYQNVASAVAVILEQDEKILFTVRGQDPQKGKLALPGGFVDPDKKVEEACAREVKEETNISIPSHKFSYFDSQPNDYQFKDFPYKTSDLIFTAELPEEFDLIREEEEIQALKWIDKKAINLNKIAFKSIRKAIEKYLRG